MLAFFVLGLAIAVFAWGVRYKTSLYNSAPPQSQHMLAAKLLSNRERPSDIAIQVERATAPSLIVACFAFALFSGFVVDRTRNSRLALNDALNSQRRPIPPAARQIFFRPPPAQR